MKKIVIRDREAGNIIEYFNTREEAKKMLLEYEKQDKKDGIFEDNFYEIAEIEEWFYIKLEGLKMDNYIIDSLSFNRLEDAFIYLLKSINPNLKGADI